MARLQVIFDPSDDPSAPLSEVIFDLQMTPFDPGVDLGQMVILAKRSLSSLDQTPRSKAENQGQGQKYGRAKGKNDLAAGQLDDLRQVNGKVNAKGKFDLFWLAYPRHVKKLEAQRVWDRQVKRFDPDLIIAAAERYRDDPHRTDQYTQYPTTWLNSGGWDNDPLPPPESANGKPPRPQNVTFDGRPIVS